MMLKEGKCEAHIGGAESAKDDTIRRLTTENRVLKLLNLQLQRKLLLNYEKVEGI